ncbi:MAG TPA: ABC transporter permease, partial [Casimicrobiaceae bacterium]
MHTVAARAGLVAPALLLLAMFFVLPVVAVGVDAFREGTASFRRVFAISGIGGDLAGSLLLTLVASSVSTAIGLGVALHLSRLRQGVRTALSFVIALPLTFSGLIVAYGFILGYGRAGFVTQLLAFAGFDPATLGGALFTPLGVAFASSYYLIPRVVIGLLPVLVNFDRPQ